jgi:hypothetical protein
MTSHTRQRPFYHVGDTCDPGKGEQISPRQMVRTNLLGQHTHRTVDGQAVHVWIRDGKYLARGRHLGRAFGLALGSDHKEAAAALRRLLVEIEDGTFRPPCEARKQQLKTGRVPRNTIRQLCEAFLAEKRRLRGKRTAGDYRNRLTPLIEFAEQPEVRRRWSLAADIEREFAVAFRAFLHVRRVTRNGRAGAREQPLSPSQIFNILDCVRTMLSWARRPDVNQLLSTFVSPFNEEVVGSRPEKDPLRQQVLPIERRMALVQQMDGWQLCQFAIAMVLPLRPEDYTGLLISEVSFVDRQLRFGTRMSGWDFNKGRQSFHVPYPPELDPLLRICAGARADGPLLRRRTIFEGRQRPALIVENSEAIRLYFDRALATAKPGEVQAKQDGKELFRRLLRNMGGVSSDSLAKEFKLLLAQLDPPLEARFYDLRGSVNTDMNRAGISHLFQLYVTGHAVDGEILSRYVSLKLEEEMQAYFRYIQPLLDCIQKRAAELGLT